MWELKQTTQFKKDLRRYLNHPEKMKALDEVLSHLSTTGTVPEKFNPHALSGNWSNHMECHIKGDFLLIWYDKEENVIKLVRLGSHSELFGK